MDDWTTILQLTHILPMSSKLLGHLDCEQPRPMNSGFRGWIVQVTCMYLVSGPSNHGPCQVGVDVHMYSEVRQRVGPVAWQ